MADSQFWFYVLAFVFSMDCGLIAAMILWGAVRREWTPPQYGRFILLWLFCIQRVYVSVRVAPRPDTKFEWDISGTTLVVGIACFCVMMWGWYYSARRGGPPCEVFRHMPIAYHFCRKFHSALRKSKCQSHQ